MPSDDIARPITVYVSHFEFENIPMDYLERKRISVIDVEMDRQEAERLRKYLRERLDDKLPGPMRIRIFGNLVIS